MAWTSFIFVVGAALCTAADARTAGHLRDVLALRATASGAHPSLIVQETGKAEQRLRVCNAYAFAAPLELTHVRSNARLGSLKYKACADYTLRLEEDDELDFKAAGDDVGTFAISKLPRTSGILLLIVQQRAAGPARGASFTSHAFEADLPGSAQVAVIDTYSGSKAKLNKVTIYDPAETNVTLRKYEDLPLNSVMFINPGHYQVALPSAGPPPASGAGAAGATLAAEAQASYVVLRVGRGGGPQEKGVAFPEELVVFPEAGGARSAAALGLGLLLAAVSQLSLL